MKKQNALIMIVSIAAVLFIAWIIVGNKTASIDEFGETNEFARIRPDYVNIVIPPNIAPLNFNVLEQGSEFFVKLSSPDDLSLSIDISSKTGQIRIPSNEWKSLLNKCRGKEVSVDIFIKDEDGRWQKYKSISNSVANDNVDGYLVYRFMKPIYNNWSNIQIRQRNLSNFSDSVVLSGQSFENGCLNCHSFVGNDPGTMTLGTRSGKFGSATLFAHDGTVEKIGAKWGYTSWHPSGKVAAFSLNKVRQFFHTTAFEDRDVVDLDSAISYFNKETNKIRSAPNLMHKDKLETYPTWSPDGKYLYFCSADIPWTDRDTMPPINYDKVKYDLNRISYDINTDTWGQIETVLTSAETGKSILLPRISPDGRFLVFCMTDYGCFPVFQPSSDLYLMDLKSGEYHEFDHNSNYSESWHSFSSNSRWLVFSSKRRDGQFTRTYISYIDQSGRWHKPFILPIKNPQDYESELRTYSVPEFITGPVEYRQPSLARMARSSDKIEVKLPVTAATPKAGQKESWKQAHE